MIVTVPSAGSEFTMVKGIRSLISPFRSTRNCPAFLFLAIRGAWIFWKKTFLAISLLSVIVNNGFPPRPPAEPADRVVKWLPWRDERRHKT
jgi:hypothetical protein